MYEICKSKGIFEELRAKDKKELDTQKRVFEDKAESKQSDRHGNKPKHFKATKPSIDEAKEHWWFWENGYCRKGIKCSCYHPDVMCMQFWSHGECDNGDKCPRRHPIQICIKHLNHSCPSGKNCVHQHPQSSSLKTNPTPTSPKPQSSPGSPFYSNGYVGSNPHTN